MDWREAAHWGVRIGITIGILWLAYWMTTTQSREATLWEKFGQSRFAAVQACAASGGDARFFCAPLPLGKPVRVNDSGDAVSGLFGYKKMDKVCVNTISGIVCDDPSEWNGNMTPQ